MKLNKLSITEEFDYLFDDKIMNKEFKEFFSNEMRARAEYRKTVSEGSKVFINTINKLSKEMSTKDL